jgi:hypothetical protein
VRNPTLYEVLSAFTAEAATALAGATAQGEEIPFEVVESERGRAGTRAPLYCYRPLTDEFIAERAPLLSALSSYAPAARALDSLESTETYIRHRGEQRVPRDPRARSEEVLRCLLSRVFEERSEFTFDPERFDLAYTELERTLYSGRCVSVVLAPVLGVALEQGTTEIELADGLALARGDALKDAPFEAVWTETADGPGEQPSVLVVLRTAQERSSQPPVSDARRRFRRLLTALRLFERGGYAVGPLAWARVDDGAWRSHALGTSGRPRLATVISSRDASDLRSLYGQVDRRMPAPSSRDGRSSEVPVADSSGSGELSWAVSRFEMGCERLAPFEALTDYLLALRALLEPEGPASGRLAQRLAVICAADEDRGALAERTAHAISLERAVIAGLAPAHPGVDALVEEMADHLRAILRDVLCGHLDVDVRVVADELLARAAVAAR